MATIALLEPFFTGSHASWAKGYQAHSKHQIEIVSMEGRHWKWRMHGSAHVLANKLTELPRQPDVLLATDMLDVAAFRGFLPSKWAGIPLVLYMHENQLTYPWSPTDQDVKGRQDRHYAFLNYRSMLAADQVWFNSAYHQTNFLAALPDFLRAFPDYRGLDTVEQIRRKSRVMPLGVNLADFSGTNGDFSDPPVLLWNHRWEYDKGPEVFFQTLFRLKEDGYSFKLIVAGEPFARRPNIFDEAQTKLEDEVIHWGYAPDKNAYQKLLLKADIQPVTSRHDFFGLSTVEAIAAGVFPLLPNRLAYPEHIPQPFHPHHLYASDEQLLTRLKDLLTRPIAPSRDLRKHINQYDWSAIAPKYDMGLGSYMTENFS